MGDYRGAIDHVKTALSLNAAEGGDIAARDKLYVRLAKCFLHLLDFGAAGAAISDLGNGVARTELQESIESLKALWAETPDESALRKQVLDNVPRYRPYL